MGLNTHRPFGSGAINLSNAGTYYNDGDQHLFEPGVNMTVKRQTRSDFCGALLLVNIIYYKGRIRESS